MPSTRRTARLQPGERIATLVSLSLTPLVIDEVRAVRMEVDRVDVRGHAILFASGIWARVPDDMPETLVLAALDVCGAPALVVRHARPGMRIAVLGAGKSGALCLAQARRSTGGKGQLLALDISEKALVGAGRARGVGRRASGWTRPRRWTCWRRSGRPPAARCATW